MVSSEVMPRMTVVVAVATRRKTCFPTVGGAIATKAKPSEDSTAFCIYLILMATIPNLISLAAIENKYSVTCSLVIKLSFHSVLLYLFAYTAVRVRIIIDIVSLNGKKKVPLAVEKVRLSPVQKQL